MASTRRRRLRRLRKKQIVGIQKVVQQVRMKKLNPKTLKSGKDVVAAAQKATGTCTSTTPSRGRSIRSCSRSWASFEFWSPGT